MPTMTYNTENTEWPVFGISAASKNLISKFFSLLDSESASVGDRLADEVFTANARAEFGGKFFEGKEEIRRSRDNAWKMVRRRRHKVLKVFAADVGGEDLMIVGHVEMGFYNGNSLKGEFAGRICTEAALGNAPRLTLYQVYADSAPIAKALESKNQS